MKPKFIYYALGSLLLVALLQQACRKSNPIPPNPNEEELITTCRIIFVDSSGIQPTTSFQYRDIDGDGGNPPSMFDTIRLKSGTTYYAEILLLDESKSPTDTVSNEVLAEADEHLFCFTVTGLNCPIQRTDSDGTYEIGLLSKWRPGATGNGTAQVELRHQPDTKDGTCAPGSTDLLIDFPFIIQ